MGISTCIGVGLPDLVRSEVRVMDACFFDAASVLLQQKPDKPRTQPCSGQIFLPIPGLPSKFDFGELTSASGFAEELNGHFGARETFGRTEFLHVS